ncbi:hypothetical protein C8R43DRAFT_543167 [Mycena crocata]|nr:hypothetical protein C8R43DRAFT_543167 [Mycena crocata]
MAQHAAIYLPQEIVDEILSYLRGDIVSLKACSLVNLSFYPTSHRLMFSRLKLRPRKPDLLPAQLERLLSRFPDMIGHVHELVLQHAYISRWPNMWPGLPNLPNLRRLCISNVYSVNGDTCLIYLLGLPSLVHFELHYTWGQPLTHIIHVLPSGLKTLALKNVDESFPEWFDKGLNLHSSVGPIHLDSLTLDGRDYGVYATQIDTHVPACLLDPRSRIILSSTRRLLFISRNSMGTQACDVLQACSPSLEHLEFQFPKDPWPDNSATFLAKRVTSTFPRLRSIAFLFSPRRLPAPLAHAGDILTITSDSELSTPLLEEITIRFNLHVAQPPNTGNPWCDDGLSAVDLALSRIPSLARVRVWIRIMNRGKHSVAEHTAFLRSAMPLTDARGILSVERLFPV